MTNLFPRPLWILALAGIACSGGDPGKDLFSNGGSNGVATGGTTASGGVPSTASGGAVTESNGGVTAAGGAVSNGGSSGELGGSSGASSGGTAETNGGAPSSSGGRSSTGGAEARGGAGTASGGAGTAGSGSGGAPSSNGGTTASKGGAASGGAASGGAPSGGAPSGGSGGAVNCETLRSRLSNLLATAQECDRTTNQQQCTGTVSTECGCTVPVNNANSSDTQAYNTALTQLKKQCPNVVCPAVLCANPQGATCSNSGPGQQGRCTATGLAAGNGPGGI